MLDTSLTEHELLQIGEGIPGSSFRLSSNTKTYAVTFKAKEKFIVLGIYPLIEDSDSSVYKFDYESQVNVVTLHYNSEIDEAFHGGKLAELTGLDSTYCTGIIRQGVLSCLVEVKKKALEVV